MLNVAMQDQNTKALALMLHAQRMEDWMQSKTSPSNVFKALQPQKEDVLTGPVLPSWFKYFDDFNARNPGESMTFMKALAFELDDAGLARVLEAGLTDGKMKAFATQLTNKLFGEWKKREISAAYAFQIVGLADIISARRVLSDKTLDFWSYRIRLWIFGAGFGDPATIAIIAAGKSDQTTKTIADNLELSLLTRWLDEKLPPLTVTRWVGALELDDTLEKYTALFKAKWSNDV
ncbi:hypothetical protein PPTG_15326 [Phytophthora nicotianae INRA-310]|uniref:RXLR phytopathogen effector protein WY-domain domain-containing protein n=1 Tax=Phytophthora nicotianae (strain INRA-310) TaxID=761204 RepID=W2PUR3_PHYN3|nr:hypothetical protein PPTG_15326 [Phytophthora nicotianae INRA-310]ETN03959.1 hypothetical protein PPTG_15326 [Phytophthora nicotianae INRA-310]